MKKTLTLLVASAALTAAVGIPAWSAINAPADAGLRPFAALFEEGAQTIPLVLASGDDDDRNWRGRSRRDDDDDHRWREGARRGHDDDDDDDCDGRCRTGVRNPAPAGTVAPPRNGLFGNDAPPQVQVK